MEKIIIDKKDYAEICRTEGAIAIMHAILENISKYDISKGDVEDVIRKSMSDFIDRYYSLLEKVGWEDKEVDNFQVVSENIIIKEDD